MGRTFRQGAHQRTRRTRGRIQKAVTEVDGRSGSRFSVRARSTGRKGV
jgi:hypothetical protein